MNTIVIVNALLFRYEPPRGYYSVQEAVELKRTEPLKSDAFSPLSKPDADLDISRYSKDGSSYSSYEILERSADRNLSDKSITPTRKELTNKQSRSESNFGFSPRDILDSYGMFALSY